MRHHRYLLVCVLPLFVPVSVMADKSTQQYLAEGNQYLARGQLNDALISFDAAIRKHSPQLKAKRCKGHCTDL